MSSFLTHGQINLNATFFSRTFASSAPAEIAFGLMAQFDITMEVSYLVMTVFLLGYVFGVSSFLCPLMFLTWHLSHSSGAPAANSSVADPSSLEP